MEAHEEQLEGLTEQVKGLATSVNDIKDILNGLPKSLEKIVLGLQKQMENHPEGEAETSSRGPPIIGAFTRAISS